MNIIITGIYIFAIGKLNTSLFKIMSRPDNSEEVDNDFFSANSISSVPKRTYNRQPRAEGINTGNSLLA